MFTSEKIKEWIQEVEERPASAPLVIQFIANRLKDLSEWNEKLRIENLELRTGKRVEEYERRITNLEYQLELIKRQFGGQIPDGEISGQIPEIKAETLNLMLYGPLGKILRFELALDSFENGAKLCQVNGFQEIDGETLRMVLAPSTEELMLIFSTGRIITHPVLGLPLSPNDQPADWESAMVPEETNLGETLACVVPISKMALADFFIQTSRKGFTKKIRKTLLPNIMENKFIGTGAKFSGDQTLDLGMNYENERFVFISYEGYLQCLMVEKLPYAVTETMRLGNSDHLVAAFPVREDQSLLVMTQTGKVLNRTGDSLEPSTELTRKGRMIYSTARREAGVRVVGAAAVSGNPNLAQSDWGLALHQNGQISQHEIAALLGSGSISVDGELLDFVAFEQPNP